MENIRNLTGKINKVLDEMKALETGMTKLLDYIIGRQRAENFLISEYNVKIVYTLYDISKRSWKTLKEKSVRQTQKSCDANVKNKNKPIISYIIELEGDSDDNGTTLTLMKQMMHDLNNFCRQNKENIGNLETLGTSTCSNIYSLDFDFAYLDSKIVSSSPFPELLASK